MILEGCFVPVPLGTYINREGHCPTDFFSLVASLSLVSLFQLSQGQRRHEVILFTWSSRGDGLRQQ